MTLKNNGKSLTDLRKETLIQVERQQEFYYDLSKTFPKHINAEVIFTLNINAIQINIKDNTLEEYEEIVEWAEVYFGSPGDRHVSKSNGEIFHAFGKYIDDDNGTFNQSLWLNNVPMGKYQIKTIQRTETIYESNCKELK